MDIEVGEYIRTKDGYIDKIVIAENEDDMYAGESNPQYLDYSSDDIKKHSKNIIDLIEVGDLIELKGAEGLKYEVLKLSWSKSKGSHIHIINPFRTEGGKDIFVEDIKSILTKKQYNANAYRLEE